MIFLVSFSSKNVGDSNGLNDCRLDCEEWFLAEVGLS